MWGTKKAENTKKFQDDELQTFLDEDDGQTQEQLAGRLDVNESTFARRPKGMGESLKAWRWVPHEQSKGRKESGKAAWEILLDWFEKCRCVSNRYHRCKMDILWEFQAKEIICGPIKKQNLRQGQTASERRQCFMYFGIIVWCYLLWASKCQGRCCGPSWQQQLGELNLLVRQKRPLYQQRQHKLIFLDENTPSHRTKETRKLFAWDIFE